MYIKQRKTKTLSKEKKLKDNIVGNLCCIAKTLARSKPYYNVL